VVNKNPWLMFYKKNANAAFRLFCFAHAGGTAAAFRKWHEQLPPEIEVCGIQLPGRASRISEAPFTRISQLVPELAAVLSTVSDKPFAFFGHSLGALLSFEMARWLRRNRQVMPRHLFLSAYTAPQIPDTDPPWHLMNDEDFMAKMAELNGTPQEVLDDKDMVALLLPMLRADCELCETYVYSVEEQLSCPITTFAGVDDDEAEDEEVAAWNIHTSGGFKHHLMEGDHFFIQSNERKLLEILSRELSKMSATIPVAL